MTEMAWQIAKVFLFIAAAVAGIKLLQRVLFPPEPEPEPAGPHLDWLRGEPVRPETLVEGDELLRDDGVVFVYLRKALPDEYREGVEEWLFHPPGGKGDLWIGLDREDVAALRRVARAGRGGEDAAR